MSKYYIEVKKPSGMKTHFGRDKEERYEPVHSLPTNSAYDHRVDAEKDIVFVSDYCKKMGMITAGISVVKISDD